MQPGDVIDERFEIVGTAGSGGMGVVFRAIDRATSTHVAVKVLRGGDPARFAREASVLAELRDPGIVRYIAHGATPLGQPYLVMEWLEGCDLAVRLQGTKLGAVETVALVRRVCAALAVAHARNVVHRDLKPSNIFLAQGRLDRPLLLDFGIARSSGGKRLTYEGAVLGTPSYMSPEQARGSPLVDPRSDVFSAGCVLFRCLVGREPFVGPDVRTILAKVVLEEAPRARDLERSVPPALDALVARTLANDPADRPRDAGELGQWLDRWMLDQERTPSIAPPIRHLGEGEQRFVTILVASQPLSAVRKPDAELLEVAARFGSRLERLRDGSILVTTTASSNLVDQAVVAARCALALRQHLPEAAIALASGRAKVGAQVTVGDVIERAMRMLRDDERNGPTLQRPQHAESQGRDALSVRLDEDTAELLDGRFEVVRESDAIFLRGQHEPFEASRKLLGRETSFVGRSREAAMLEGVLASCVDEPQARAVWLHGPAGAGKSRLCHELLRNARALEVLVAQGDPVGAGSAFGMAAQIVRRAAWLRDLEPIERRRAKIAARIARHVEPDEQRRVTMFLAELAGAGFAEEDAHLDAARRDPRLMGDQIRAAFQDWILAEARAQPVLLLLEDVHWGDPPSLRLAESLVRNLADVPLLILAVSRPEGSEAIAGLSTTDGFISVGLAPIRPRAAQELVLEVLGRDLPREKLDWIVNQAAGNALHLEEVIRAVASGNELQSGTVLASVQARLDSLDGNARRVLRAASVFGQVARQGGVAALLGAEPTLDLPDQIHALVDAEVLHTRQGDVHDETELVFRHALVREAAYAMLTEEDRALGHKLAGEWLERTGERDATIMAEHYERGGERLRASVWFERAAQQALEGDDLQGAVDRANRGVINGASGEAHARLLHLMADAHRWQGRNDEMIQRAGESLALARFGSRAWWTTVELVAIACGRLGERERLAWLADEVDRAAKGEFHDERLRAETTLARMMLLLGHRARAERILEYAATKSRAAQDEPRLWAPWDALMSLRGKFAENHALAVRHAIRALESYEWLGDRRNAAIVRCNIGNIWNTLGGFEQAEEMLRAAVAHAERLGLRGLVAQSQNNLGWSLTQLGRVDEGVRMLEAAIAALTQQGDARMAGGAYAHLALAFLANGELDRAEPCARKAAELLHATPPLASKGLATLARVSYARGASVEALTIAREAKATMESPDGAEEGHALARLAYAEALHGSGDFDGARRAIEAARDRLLARAASFDEPELREPFLRRVPENVRTFELADAWSKMPPRVD